MQLSVKKSSHEELITQTAQKKLDKKLQTTFNKL